MYQDQATTLKIRLPRSQVDLLRAIVPRGTVSRELRRWVDAGLRETIRAQSVDNEDAA